VEIRTGNLKTLRELQMADESKPVQTILEGIILSMALTCYEFPEGPNPIAYYKSNLLSKILQFAVVIFSSATLNRYLLGSRRWSALICPLSSLQSM